MRLLASFFILIAFIDCNIHSSQNKDEKNNDWQLLPFIKAGSINPILTPDPAAIFTSPIIGKVKWEAKAVFNPAAVVRHDTVFLLYRAQDKKGKYSGTSRIGLAWSTDGFHFTKNPLPVLYPDNDEQKKYEWEGGCEDPRIVQSESGTYYMTYTAYDGKIARLMVASSPDLYHWTKHGHIFAKAFNGKYINEWSKSGSIICKYEDGKNIAVKIGGKYWMYWGDTNIFLAISDDLINWTPVEKTDGKLQVVFGPRIGKFDSDLVESGPPAMLTNKGIVLIYNSRNVLSKGDSTLPEGTYAPSEILFDRNEPGKVLDRMDIYFMKPDMPYEISGQVNQVCFAEGLINYKGKWFLYYGTADSKIAVAVK